jgi:short-subunit dehydrogenase involved in D-alanine esterification of teichoic acids
MPISFGGNPIQKSLYDSLDILPFPWILSISDFLLLLTDIPIFNMSTKSLTLPPSLSLAGKSAIVTGSSRSIGRGLALILAQRGAAVTIIYTSDNSTAQAQSLAAEINALTRACIIKADLTDLDYAPKIIQGALRGLAVDKIDILVNSTARGPPPLPATDFDIKEYDITMNINVRAPMLLVQELLPALSTKDGRIINMCAKLLSCKCQIPSYPFLQARSDMTDFPI